MSKTYKMKHNGEKPCECCGKTFPYFRKTAKFCSYKCEQLTRKRKKIGDSYDRTCKECGKTFCLPVGESRGMRIHHCSDECARISARKSKAASHKRAEEGTTAAGVGRPRTLSDAERALRRQLSVSTRFFVRYPWIDKACQACGERRVVELAHKVPRLSAWRTAKNTTPADVWVLCPTCHRVLDYGIETAEQLGLWDLPSEAPLKAA